jgi:hypothetical protein
MIDFGTIPPGCAETFREVTITNVGDATLDVRSIFLDGLDASMYEIDTSKTTLGPGGSAVVTIWFTPTGWHDYEDVSLLLLSDDPDEGVVDVSLSGRGAELVQLSERFDQIEPSPVDLVFVLDNSGSMEDEVAELNASFGAFLEAFHDIGLDYRIAVTTTDMDDPYHRGLFQGIPITPDTLDPVLAFAIQTDLGTDGSGEERGFDAAMAALSTPNIDGQNSNFIREEANLAVVVVSDEDDSSVRGANTFANWLEGMKPDPGQTSFSALVGPDSDSYYSHFACDLLGGQHATSAPHYHDAIEATGGVWADICEGEMIPFLQHLSWVSAGLLDSFALTGVPEDLTEVQVTVDGAPIPWGAVDGWKWDPTIEGVVLHGAAVPAPGSTILVEYTAEALCRP